MNKRSPLILMAVLTVFLSVSGCSKLNREDLELLKRGDSQFQNMLSMKENAEHEIVNLQGRLSGHRRDLNLHISHLKSSHREETEHLETKISDLRSKIETNREVYKQDITALHKSLGTKEREVRELERALQDLNGILNKKGTFNLTAGETRNWNSKKETMEKKVAILNQEIESLRSQKSFKKRKLKYL